MRRIVILTVAAVVISLAVGRETNEIVPDFKDANQEELLQWVPPPELVEEYPYYLSGFDDDGSPIWVSELGKWDTRKSADGGPERERDYKKYLLQMLARCKDSVKLRSTEDNPVTDFNLIFDMDGFTMRQTGSPQAIGMMLWIARQAEQAFTENLKQCYIVNANFIFTSIWSLMRPILGRAVYKVDVFGTNRNQWTPRILKLLPKDQIPEWYGGHKDHQPVQIYG